jgi:hypothetical protein
MGGEIAQRKVAHLCRESSRFCQCRLLKSHRAPKRRFDGKACPLVDACQDERLEFAVYCRSNLFGNADL